MLRSFKYRIYPNKLQQEQIDKTFNACRFIYNLCLETKQWVYKTHGINLSAYDLQKQLTDLKNDCTWLRDVDSQALQKSIANLTNAFMRLYKGGGYPNYKSKLSKQTFTSVTKEQLKIDFRKGLMQIPKIKGIKIRIDRVFIGTINTVTISKTTTGKYYASVLVKSDDIKITKTIPDINTSIGIDLGVKDFVTTSEGYKIKNQNYLGNSLKRLAVLQRRLSRKKKGSSNRKKAVKRVGLLHEKVTNQRKDFLHNTSTSIVNDNQVSMICIEDLNVKGMVKNRKLSKAISDVSWGEFTRQLEYKSEWYGKTLQKIGRFEPSSKTCNCCGVINQDLTLSDRVWTCTCGVTHDRDINAAINIKNIGFKMYSGQGMSIEPVELPTLVGAMKQEDENHAIDKNK